MKTKLQSIVIGIVAIIGCNIGFQYAHTCPKQLPPTRLNIQLHWIDKHNPNYKIKNTLDSKMLDICSRECMPDYKAIMERGE